MRMVDIILKKRYGGELTADEIEYFIQGYVAGEIPDYQAAAFLMAVCWRGMTREEISRLTMSMTYSGEVVDLSAIPGVKVDKHSTGGVGDTTTLVVTPLVAACGVPVAKMSGRGLGHTGGTLDKLESLPGVSVSLDIDAFIELVKRTGIAVIGQTGNLVPADKLLYALRDVTGTVDSIPLIASSIMSKKIAAGSDAIVLDVKMGSGAFMRTREEAFELGRVMVDIGSAVGRQVVAVVTDMNQPLGMAVGNALEVQEAIEALSGQIPETDPLVEVSLLLGKYMLLLGGVAGTEEEAGKMLRHALRNGSGLQNLREMIAGLGGDGSCCDDPASLARARRKIPVCAQRGGFVHGMNAVKIGEASLLLGAGRTKKGDRIDGDVGLVMKKRVGDRVEQGEPLAIFHVNDEKKLQEAETLFLSAVEIGEAPMERPPMVYGVIRKEN